jgi:hypothetical protein
VQAPTPHGAGTRRGHEACGEASANRGRGKAIGTSRCLARAKSALSECFDWSSSPARGRQVPLTTHEDSAASGRSGVQRDVNLVKSQQRSVDACVVNASSHSTSGRAGDRQTCQYYSRERRAADGQNARCMTLCEGAGPCSRRALRQRIPTSFLPAAPSVVSTWRRPVVRLQPWCACQTTRGRPCGKRAARVPPPS